MLETRLVTKSSENSKEEWKTGYFLSLDELDKLLIEFLLDSKSNGLMSEQRKTFIENWLKTNKI